MTDGAEKTNFCLEGFKTFFKIGLFTLGGGYAMIPLLEQEVVARHKWLDDGEFADVLAVAQALPGVFAVNMSIHIGYKLRGLRGALALASGTVLPSFIIILLIAMAFRSFRENAVFETFFRGVRPAVVALIALPVFRLARTAKVTLVNVWIPLVAALAIWLLGVSPVYVIVLAAAGGWLFGLVTGPKASDKFNLDDDE